MLKNGTLTSSTRAKDGDQMQVERLYDRISKRIRNSYELHKLLKQSSSVLVTASAIDPVQKQVDCVVATCYHLQNSKNSKNLLSNSMNYYNKS